MRHNGLGRGLDQLVSETTCDPYPTSDSHGVRLLFAVPNRSEQPVKPGLINHCKLLWSIDLALIILAYLLVVNGQVPRTLGVSIGTLLIVFGSLLGLMASSLFGQGADRDLGGAKGNGRRRRLVPGSSFVGYK